MLNYKIASLLGLLEMSQFALLSQNIGLGLCVCRVCFQLRLSFKAGDSSCASFIPPKIVWFSLTLLKSKLLPGLVWWKIITSDRLQTIHPGYYLSPQIYSLSDNGPETVDHLFIHCNIMWRTEAHFFKELSLQSVVSQNCADCVSVAFFM